MNAIQSLILFPLRPTQMAQAHAQTDLGRVLRIHAWGMIVLGLVFVALDGFANYYHNNHFRPRGTMEVLTDFDALCIAVLVIAGGEGVFIAVASCMTCWASRNEPAGESWRYAIRISWLFVAHLWWVVGIGGFIIIISEPRQAFGLIPGFMGMTMIIVWSIVSYLRALTARERPIEPAASADDSDSPLTIPNGTNVDENPVRSRDPIGASGETTASYSPAQDSLLELGGPDHGARETQRAVVDRVGVDASPSSTDDRIMDDALLCEWCGYSLMHLDRQGHCPECGRRVADSLAQGPRQPMTEFKNAAEAIRFSIRSWLHAESTWRSVFAHQRSVSMIQLFGWSIIGSGVTSWAAVVVPLLIVISDWDWWAGVLMFLVIAGFNSFAMFMFASLVASLAGWRVSRSVGRNRFTSAWNIAASLSAILPIWTGLAWGSIVVLALAETTRGTLQSTVYWLIANGCVGLFFGAAVWRRMPYVQYANR